MNRAVIAPTIAPDALLMREALKEAYDGIRAGDGGPFGCVIAQGDRIVGRGHNRVILKRDPTCHGEMEAIRDACKALGTFDLSGCTLYSTAEPCPMCLGAILWANIRQVFFGCGRLDSEAIGFRDELFYRYLNGEGDILSVLQFGRGECLELFNEYKAMDDKKNY